MKSMKKIPEDTEAEILFKANLLCCVDQERDDHIHHIDGDPSNADIDNLVLLCFNCHDRATVKSTLRKKLSPKALMKFRNHHYQVTQSARDKLLKKLDRPITQLTEQVLLKASMEVTIQFQSSKGIGE